MGYDFPNVVLLGTLSGRKALCGKVLYGRDEPQKHFKALNSTFFFPVGFMKILAS